MCRAQNSLKKEKQGDVEFWYSLLLLSCLFNGRKGKIKMLLQIEMFVCRENVWNVIFARAMSVCSICEIKVFKEAYKDISNLFCRTIMQI